jgi:apolipoprotein D and lipocalin family protein
LNIPRSIVSGLCLACAVLCGACAGTPGETRAPPRLAPALDLPRFMGRWYVVANIPHAAEAGYVGSYVEYALRADGAIDDLYSGHKSSFEKPLGQRRLADSVVPGSGNARWHAAPSKPAAEDFEILYVDPGYQYALIGDPERKYGRLFARSPQIGEEKYHELLARFDQQGYDTARFQRVPQTIEQLGLPGFQTP